MQSLEEIKLHAPELQDNILVEYECAILLHKLKGTFVVPVFVAGAARDDGGSVSFSPFNINELDSSNFPQAQHCRNPEGQSVIDDLKTSIPPHELDFLGSIAKTITQLRKFPAYFLYKRTADEQELQSLVGRVMEELERGN